MLIILYRSALTKLIPLVIVNLSHGYFNTWPVLSPSSLVFAKQRKTDTTVIPFSIVQCVMC